MIGKILQLFSFTVILLAFLLVASALALLPLLPITKIEAGPWIFGTIAFFAALAIDLFWAQYKKVLQIRREALKYEPEGIVGTLASWYKFFALWRHGPALVISALVFAIFLFLLLRGVVQQPLVLRDEFFAVIGGYLVYFLIRPLLRKTADKFSQATAKNLPSYTLEPDGLVIDLKAKAIGKGSAPLMRIPFKDLEEIRVFASMQEAETFLQYSVGPDVRIMLQQMTDLFQFLRGAIPRPRAYLLLASNGIPVFLRGRDLFYLVSFQNPDVSDLLHAFEASKAKP